MDFGTLSIRMSRSGKSLLPETGERFWGCANGNSDPEKWGVGIIPTPSAGGPEPVLPPENAKRPARSPLCGKEKRARCPRSQGASLRTRLMALPFGAANGHEG